MSTDYDDARSIPESDKAFAISQLCTAVRALAQPTEQAWMSPPLRTQARRLHDELVLLIRDVAEHKIPQADIETKAKSLDRPAQQQNIARYA